MQIPPKHWINSSTATIYRHAEDRQMDEASGETGCDFSMNVAKLWEKAFFRTNTPRTLKTAMRTTIVLGRDGGAYPMLRNLAKTGFGGRQGNGRQFISWVHETDFARAVDFIITKSMQGVVNIAAPEPVRNEVFMAMLRRKYHMPFELSLSEKLLKAGAKLIGTETELVLKSRNVIPARLTEEGFVFKYPTAHTALKHL